MSEDAFEHVREKDHAVLQCLREGNDDTRQIREVTTLSNHDVNYCLDKLEDLGLIETETPDGRVTEVVDGQQRNFKAPRHARLTDAGLEYIANADRDQTPYRELTHEELVKRIRNLEEEVDALRDAFDAFRQQVLTKIQQ